MEDEAYFRAKVEQCRRMAGAITRRDDPAIDALIKLAAELEAKAHALAVHERSKQQPQF